MSSDAQTSPCQACGACCAYSSEWPRFTTENDETIALIPAKLKSTDDSRMLCIDDRCSALRGEIGKLTACSIYAIRPDVCRACEPGDYACAMARERHGLPLIAES